MLDDIGVVDYLGIGCHEAIHVGPDFQHGSIEFGGQDGGRIIRTTPTQVGGLVVLHTTGNKTTHHNHVWCFCKRPFDQIGGQFKIDDVLAVLFNGLDQITGIQMTSIQKFGDEIG
ncbi:MAG: hypothetical protein BWY72_00833 [Bacteroidetes bacterium ADurb.Bin416]|nr:MAG: hypothetical protein BWY72_00833 [Bacteroidetes bacterium ADurb.Bin416]